MDFQEHRKAFPAIAKLLARANANKVEEEAAWNEIDEVRLQLLHEQMDNNYHQAIIDGSWPTADEQIKRAREDRSSRPAELVNLHQEIQITVMYCDIEGCPKQAYHDLAGLDLCEKHYQEATGGPVKALPNGQAQEETGQDRVSEMQG